MNQGRICILLLTVLSFACSKEDAPVLGTMNDPNMSAGGPAVPGPGPDSTTPTPGPTEQPSPSVMPPTPTTDNTTPAEPAAAMASDYSVAANWLCRPDNNDHCAVNLDTTIVKADGTTEVEAFVPATDPAIDCFYVYPTVSLDTTGNSDLVPGPEEAAVVRAQFARFAQHCRLFAPMYRQVTLTALRAVLGGMPLMADRKLAYTDVAAAFKHYMENDNNGRGFVLVGHSQGSGVLTQLIKDEIDKDPVDSKFLTAMIIGSSVTVPKDAPVGGTFQHVPVCESADQLGCIITYASFRSDSPPPADSFFATSADPNLVASCTNPAAPAGGAADLHAYMSTGGPGASGLPMGDWADGLTVDTPFVSVPGLLSAECKFAESGSYLSITVNADGADPRTDEITGDVVTDGEVQKNWGLHLIDVHLGMGNLLDLTAAKAAAYAAAE